MRRQMTADIAHDLRTPLTVLSGYLEAMREGVLQPTADRLELMEREVRYLKRLVEDLRTLSLADAGELSLNRQWIAPSDLLHRVAAVYDHQTQQRETGLHVQVDRDTPQIHVDPERIVQTFSNLVANALRYTPVGGQIVLGAQAQGRDIHLSVRDSGAGIPPDVLPHIFDRFYRGDASVKSKTMSRD